MGGRGGSLGGKSSLKGNYISKGGLATHPQSMNSKYNLANHGGSLGFTEDQWKGNADATYKALGYNTSNGGLLYDYGNGKYGGKNRAMYSRLSKDGNTYIYEISNPQIIKKVSNSVIPATANRKMSEAIRNTLGIKPIYDKNGKYKYTGLE